MNQSKWGIPEWDIWSLHVMDHGSCQIGTVVGTPSPPPSPASSCWHSGQGTVFGVFKLDVDSYESARNFDTWVLHRISSRIDLAEWFGLGAILPKHGYLVMCFPKMKCSCLAEIWKFKMLTKNVQMSISTHPKFKFSRKNQFTSLTSIPSGGSIQPAEELPAKGVSLPTLWLANLNQNNLKTEGLSQKQLCALQQILSLVWVYWPPYT